MPAAVLGLAEDLVVHVDLDVLLLELFLRAAGGQERLAVLRDALVRLFDVLIHELVDLLVHIRGKLGVIRNHGLLDVHGAVRLFLRKGAHGEHAGDVAHDRDFVHCLRKGRANIDADAKDHDHRRGGAGHSQPLHLIFHSSSLPHAAFGLLHEFFGRVVSVILSAVFLFHHAPPSHSLRSCARARDSLERTLASFSPVIAPISRAVSPSP